MPPVRDLLELSHKTVTNPAGAILIAMFIWGRRMQPKKSSLSTLSNEALCKLRDEVVALLNSRAEGLRRELIKLTGDTVAHAGDTNGATSAPIPIRKKATPKYRGPDGKTWCGRGARPRWLVSALKEGKKVEDFLIVQSNSAGL
jgi:DNA-binding protein H-NS